MVAPKISPVTGHYVDVDVADVTYQVFYLHNGTGIPLLCQHTAGCHNHQYRNLLRDPAVTERFQVIAYDLPYHGKSDPPNGEQWWTRQYDLTAEFFQEFVVNFARTLELDRPVFMGSSMGGVVALHLARDHSEKFRALIALEAADYTPGFYLDWWHHPAVEDGSVAASVIEGLIAPQTSELDRRLTMHYYAQAAPGVLKGDLYFYSVEHDMRETVSEIDTSKVPLYLLTGEYDYLSTPTQTIATAEKIVGAKVETMCEIGHFPMSENHDTFMTYLRPILDEIAERHKEP
ncbi:alpha/beta fold hydrolase [Pseudonocardia asaccharolytica]|uniref:Carboxylesterase n=1 Tax=Pseudonocardia asaccharolytica DSM 44247 = NBRC 16224 TaxID=1123024 RepID=A0A511D5V6_9PSEU|nr:alpha/beta hydrolase [Pseudonocardia asaccharolytica]GEL18308.1 carboxylesterase [Pseudonocardia asaccharolytica DSM 44247 = NBRC 16224]